MGRVITIRILGGSEQGQPTPTPVTGGNEPNPKAKDDKQERTMGDLIQTYIGKRAFNIVKSQATQFAGKYFDASEAYSMQVAVGNAVDTIESLVNIGTTGKIAAKAFALAGFSAPLGFAIGAGASLMGKVASAVGTYADASRGLIESAYGNNFYGERAGFQTGGHGTEN